VSDRSDEAEGLPAETADESAPSLQPRDRRAQLVARLGHEDDPQFLLNEMVEGERAFESGDNRTAQVRFRAVLAGDPSPELASAARRGLAYTRPDRRALLVGGACFALLIVAWIAALAASH